MGTEKQEKHTIDITFLFTSEGHETIWEPWILFFWTSGFLTRPDTNSHRHNLVWDVCPISLELSHKARYQLTQARSHCWLWHSLTKLIHKYVAWLIPQMKERKYSSTRTLNRLGTESSWWRQVQLRSMCTSVSSHGCSHSHASWLNWY
jgi:hypothetical protein